MEEKENILRREAGRAGRGMKVAVGECFQMKNKKRKFRKFLVSLVSVFWGFLHALQLFWSGWI